MFPHAGEDEEVDEVHAAEDQQDDSDFGTDGFEHPLCVDWIFIRF